MVCYITGIKGKGKRIKKHQERKNENIYSIKI